MCCALVLLPCLLAMAQHNDSTKTAIGFKGSVSLTNNGFSFIPSFTLGKPAAIVNLAVGGKKFSFEPELRFSLEGKPWSFIFIWRYKLINTSKFQFTVGTHLPAIAFRTVSTEVNGVVSSAITAQRFLPVEAAPTYKLGKNANIGLYYLYARGIEADATLHTHFVALRGNVAQIPLPGQLRLRLNPQAFYLKTDAKDGYYTAMFLALSKDKFPISLSAMMNRAIRKSIAGDDFTWNVSLVYSFDTQWRRQ